MKKRNLCPQQVAPVARETTATSFQQGQVTPCLYVGFVEIVPFVPFAGDDAE